MKIAEISAALINGAAADIWYDAHEFGGDTPDDPDRKAESLIADTQAAMAEAASLLTALCAPVICDRNSAHDGQVIGLEPDGTIIQEHERGEPYSCGESLFEFGYVHGDPDPLADLSEKEAKAILAELYLRIWPEARRPVEG